jgi:hypothetical protein
MSPHPAVLATAKNLDPAGQGKPGAVDEVGFHTLNGQLAAGPTGRQPRYRTSGAAYWNPRIRSMK